LNLFFPGEATTDKETELVNESISSSEPESRLPYRVPALKCTWVITRVPASNSITFAPLVPGLQAFALHHVSPPQLRLLELLKGEYSVEDIQQRLQTEFPHLLPDKVVALLTQLDRAGLLEEADLQPPADWTPEYVERYSRHLAVFAGYERDGLSRFDQQQRFHDAHVVILGMGGIGSWVALLLTQLGIGHLTLVDDDPVNISNLTRQALYTERDVGRNKALAASEALHAINSETKLTTITRAIKSEEALMPICQGSTLVILTFGPFLLREPTQLHYACLRQNVPCVSLSGLHLGPLVVPGQTACFDCVRAFFARQLPGLIPEGIRRGEEAVLLSRRYHAIFAPLIATCIGLGVTEVTKFLAGFATSALENGILYLNPTELSITHLSTPRDPACPTCGERGAKRKEQKQ
jgi:bacteriocin biosynthesis cyclodehydratase domain-containing protein